MADQNLHDRFVAGLIAQVANDRYPSTTVMETLEQAMTARHVGAYLQVLMQKIADERYPSTDLMKRVASLFRAWSGAIAAG